MAGVAARVDGLAGEVFADPVGVCGDGAAVVGGGEGGEIGPMVFSGMEKNATINSI